MRSIILKSVHSFQFLVYRIKNEKNINNNSEAAKLGVPPHENGAINKTINIHYEKILGSKRISYGAHFYN